jgi:ATP-dependent helicase/nuclease subunit A
MSNDIGGADYSESHQMVFGNTSYEEAGLTTQNYQSNILEYQLEGREYSKDEVEAFIIAKDIKDKVNNKHIVFDMANQIQRPCSYNDFVILMDRATTFDLYKKIFEYLEIPLTLYKDESLSESEDIYLIRNMLDLLIEIESNRFGVNFKYDYISIARSFLYEINDDIIFDDFFDNRFVETDIYKQFKDISLNIKSSSVYDILNQILDSTDFYNKMIVAGDVSKRQIRIIKILELAIDLGNNGYDIYQFKEYLDKLLEEEYDIKYSLNTSADNTVKIMTIHKSKGLEYPICYYSGLSKSFNISDLKDKFLYSKKYGFIAPYFNEGIRENVLKLLMKENYIEEEISEKIRLFYVALTRAKEQMIILLPKSDLADGQPRLIDSSIRRKYRSLADIMYSVRGEIQNQIIEVDLKDINITKNYLYQKDISKLDVLDSNDIVVEELDMIVSEKEQQHYSKSVHKLITEDIDNNIKLGLQIHEVLEYIDFKNPDLELIDNTFIRSKVEQLLNHKILNNIERAKIYKEYEFIYEEDNVTHHGIIDCMIEYNDYIDIIDYKLKNTDDEAYLKQLNGYADYIKNKTNKKINIYLYSIIDGELKELEY